MSSDHEPTAVAIPSVCSSPLLASLFRPREGALPVIDPELKHLGRFWVDQRKVIKTYGLLRYHSSNAHPPSLCLLYQENRCNAGGKCNQIHVKRSHMKNLHKALQAQPMSNCCLQHGDIASGRLDILGFLEQHSIVLWLSNGESLHVPSHLIAITNHWERFLTACLPGNTVHVPLTRICNLHQQRHCRYGVDCRNVHVCREFWQQCFGEYPPMMETEIMNAHHLDHASEVTEEPKDRSLPVTLSQMELAAEDAALNALMDLAGEDSQSDGMTETPPDNLSGLEGFLPEAPTSGWRTMAVPPAPLKRSGSISGGNPMGHSISMDTISPPATPMTYLMESFARVLSAATDNEDCRLSTYLRQTEHDEETPHWEEDYHDSKLFHASNVPSHPYFTKPSRAYRPAMAPRTAHHNNTGPRWSPPHHPSERAKHPKALRNNMGSAQWNRNCLFGAAVPPPVMGH